MKNIFWSIREAPCDMESITQLYLSNKSAEYRNNATICISENSSIIFSDYGDASKTAIAVDYIQHYVTSELICIIVIVEDYEHSANTAHARHLLDAVKSNVLAIYEASGWADITYMSGSWVEVDNFDI